MCAGGPRIISLGTKHRRQPVAADSDKRFLILTSTDDATSTTYRTLLTTDGGASFAQVGSLRSVGANQAPVFSTTASGHQVLGDGTAKGTVDGGRTWFAMQF